MSIYIYILIIILFLSVFNNLKNNKYYSYIAYLILFLIAAFRSAEIGNDLNGYIDVFQLDIDRGIKGELEWGYKIISNVLLKYSDDASWYIFSTSTLIFVPFYILLLKKSNNPIFSLLIFFIIGIGFGFFLTAIRQAMAVAICFWAFNFFENKKYFYFVILVLIASTIHMSALFCLLFLLITIFLPSSKKILLFSLYISVLIGFVSRINVFDFLPILSKIPGFSGAAGIYSFYTDYHTNISPNFNGLFLTIIPISIFAYFGIKYDPNSLYSRLLYTGVILTNVFASTPSIPRYFVYLTIFQILVIPKVYPLLKKEEKFIVHLVMSLLITYFLFFSLKINGIYMYSFN